MNEHSSRSHSIFTITLESRLRRVEEDGGETVTFSKLVSPDDLLVELVLQEMCLLDIPSHLAESGGPCWFGESELYWVRGTAVQGGDLHQP